MKYFWEMCCSHGENLLPLSEEAHDWRCRFRSIYNHAVYQDVGPLADWGVYGNGPYAGFYAAATLQMELRDFEHTFPQSLLDPIYDSAYRVGVVNRLLEDKVRSHRAIKLKDEELPDRLQLDTYNDFFRVYQRLFDHEWRIPGDALLIIVLSQRLSSLWVPARSTAFRHPSPELDGLRETVKQDLEKEIEEKSRRIF